MHLRFSRLSASFVLALCMACGGGETLQPVNGGLQPGESLQISGARSVAIQPGSSAGEYAAVVVNVFTGAAGAEGFTLRGDSITTPASFALEPASPLASRSVSGVAATGPTLDRAFEARLRARERQDLQPRVAAARAWYASRMTPVAGGASLSPTARRSSTIPSTVQVGDSVLLNLNVDSSCNTPIYRKARVAAISSRAIVLTDSANPSGGFTDADYQRFAIRFDTLIYPLDTAAFGNPTDIDGNGKVALIFTVEINKQTPANSSVFTSGITFSRDLFPKVGTPRAKACPTSNEAEAFYLLAPDPLGRINGNRRSTGFVDSNTTVVIAHEFQHLINQSRRLYVNNAPVFEATWLDEGLAHTAEELLFFHESGLTPKLDLTAGDIQASTRRRTAFNLDMTGNIARYRQYLILPFGSSPYSATDDLSTRGAAYDFLRYLVDHTADPAGDIFFRLANSRDSGMVNLRAVFGADMPSFVRDWSVSQVVDDLPAPDAQQQPSWNWRSQFTTVYGAYPLRVQRMTTGATYSQSAIPGGAAFFAFGVPAGATGTVSLGGQAAGSTNLQLVIVRVK